MRETQKRGGERWIRRGKSTSERAERAKIATQRAHRKTTPADTRQTASKLVPSPKHHRWATSKPTLRRQSRSPRDAQLRTWRKATGNERDTVPRNVSYIHTSLALVEHACGSPGADGGNDSACGRAATPSRGSITLDSLFRPTQTPRRTTRQRILQCVATGPGRLVFGVVQGANEEERKINRLRILSSFVYGHSKETGMSSVSLLRQVSRQWLAGRASLAQMPHGTPSAVVLGSGWFSTSTSSTSSTSSSSSSSSPHNQINQIESNQSNQSRATEERDRAHRPNDEVSVPDERL